jgi:chaperonin cofactor prefoldin
MFFEEQIELKAEVESLENEVSNLNETVAHIMSELKILQLKLT